MQARERNNVPLKPSTTLVGYESSYELMIAVGCTAEKTDRLIESRLHGESFCLQKTSFVTA